GTHCASFAQIQLRRITRALSRGADLGGTDQSRCPSLPLRLVLPYQTGRKRSRLASYQLRAHARTPAFGVAPKGGLPDRTQYRPIKTHRAATVWPQEKARPVKAYILSAALMGRAPDCRGVEYSALATNAEDAARLHRSACGDLSAAVRVRTLALSLTCTGAHP